MPSGSLVAQKLLDALRGDSVLLILDNSEVMLEENTVTIRIWKASLWWRIL